MNNRQPTPLEKLITDRQRLKRACAEQEQKLNETFAYMQENSGKLLLSGISLLLFPEMKNKKEQGETEQTGEKKEENLPAATFNLSDYMSIGQTLLPIAWSVTRPLLTAWGIQKVQVWLIKKLFKKKK